MQPELVDTGTLQRNVEALLFVASEALSIKQLAKLTGAEESEVSLTLQRIDQEFAHRGVVLHDEQAAAPDQLEDGEEGDDDAGAVEAGAQREERGAALAPDGARDQLHLLDQRDALADDGALLRLGGAQRGGERGGELRRIDTIALNDL
ncbi:MAG: SMC-Scp complex subunit ScpB, partial [Candidatus Eremiobacteraeota bacterium]|nr:SMC-Scp complex subunit ScpB [Candidatus Eremiobacteraeota bacterium]